MTRSESMMLVNFAAVAIYSPESIPEIRPKALGSFMNPSPDLVLAMDQIERIIKEAQDHFKEAPPWLLFRRKLINLCRDVQIVSKHAPEYPLSAAKSAILNACD